MFLSLETLTSIMRTGLAILVELIHMVNSVSSDLTQMVNFPTCIPDCDSHSSAVLDLFISSDAIAFVLHWLSLHWEILIMLSQFPMTFQLIRNRMPHFIALFMSILVLIGMVFVIISEMLHGMIYLNLVLLLLLVNFVSGVRLKLMYISLIENIRSSLIHLHGFQLVVQLNSS